MPPSDTDKILRCYFGFLVKHKDLQKIQTLNSLISGVQSISHLQFYLLCIICSKWSCLCPNLFAEKRLNIIFINNSHREIDVAAHSGMDISLRMRATKSEAVAMLVLPANEIKLIAVEV